MKVMAVLIRREFWEHRVLVIAPLIMCVVYLALSVLASANFHMGSVYLGNSGQIPASFSSLMHIMFTGLLYVLTGCVTFFYLSDSLYAERRDRSILFWKSLPVSDAMTVISKLLVALIAVPLVVLALSIVTHLLVLATFKVGGLIQPTRNPVPHWTVLSWFKLNGFLLLDLFVFALWYAPIAAYQLLVSVVAGRAVFVWTVLPPLMLVFGQKLLFDSWSIGQFMLYRLGALSLGGGMRGNLDDAIDGINALPVLELPDLWIGVIVAAALVFVTIRIRRHRDDS